VAAMFIPSRVELYKASLFKAILSRRLWGLEPAAFTLQYSQVHAELEELSNSSYVQKTFEFNGVDSLALAQGLGLAFQSRTFTGGWEQSWPDALPAACCHQ